MRLSCTAVLPPDSRLICVGSASENSDWRIAKTSATGGVVIGFRWNAVVARELIADGQTMADRCFYKMLGEEFGPISLEMLREMVSTGQLAGDDEVRMDTRGGWVRIATVPELNGRGGGGPDRFTPQKTRGLFSSINETVEGSDSVVADTSDLEAFSDLGELEIVSEMAPPVKAPAAKTAPASPPPSPPSRATRPASPPAAAPRPASPGSTPATPARTAPRAAPVRQPQAPVARPAAPLPTAPAAYPQAVPPGYAMPVAYAPPPVVVAAPPMAAPPPAAVDSERQWYCWTNNQQYGPVTIDMLVQWARSGRLSRNDHIKLTEEGEWLVAGSVEELFSDEANAAPAKGDANVEIRVQSRDEYREEQARLAAEAAPAKVEEKEKPAAQKFEPLMGKDFFKQQAEAKKKAAGGEMDRNKMMMIGLAVAVPILLCIYFPPWQYIKFTSVEQKAHDRLRNHYMALREFRTKSDSAGWSAYAQKAGSDVKSIADSLKSTASAAYPARQQLLYAARDHWPKMVEDSASKAGPGEEEFNKALTTARAEMRKKKK